MSPHAGINLSSSPPVKLKEWIDRRGVPVWMLTKKYCVKIGTHNSLAKAQTMRFVAKHTSVPVPKVYCALERRGVKYIVVERIEGGIWLGEAKDGGV